MRIAVVGAGPAGGTAALLLAFAAVTSMLALRPVQSTLTWVLGHV